jgi:6-phosphogluconolactonase
MMREVLFEKVHIPEGNIHPIETHLPGPDEAASRYEEEMIRFFRLKPRQIPQFDLVLLGLGEDGHTASLFPGSPVLHDTNHLARAVARDKELFHRITITIPVINHSEHTMFLVEGASKAAALKKVAEEKDQALPATRIRPIHDDLHFLADREAAGLLSKDTYVTVADPLTDRP